MAAVILGGLHILTRHNQLVLSVLSVLSVRWLRFAPPDHALITVA